MLNGRQSGRIYSWQATGGGLIDSVGNAASWMRWLNGHTATAAAHAVDAEVLDLFDRTRERLLRYLSGFEPLTLEDSEDVIQEAFLALHRHLILGRSRENLTAWLFQVVHNLGLKRVIGSRQALRRNVVLTPATEDLVVDGAPNPEDLFAESQKTDRLRAVVRALPELDQRCLMLRAEGLRYREIARILNISLGGVAHSIEKSLDRIARAAARR